MGTFLLLVLLCGVMPVMAVEQEKVYRVGKGVKEPILLKSIQGTYTPAARDARIQGAVLLDIVISSKGKVASVAVLSPLGFGLDESAIDAVRSWEFKPGTKDGEPVAIRAEVQMFFRMSGGKTDISMERERTLFNKVLKALQDKDPTMMKGAVAALREVSIAGYVPAMYLEGVLLREGQLLPKDENRSRQLIEAAAERRYGPALAEVAKMYLTGNGRPADKTKGLEMLRSSASLGSTDGQFLMAQLYETGNGVPQDVTQARKYYRLCAAKGEGMCQERLAGLLTGAQKSDRDYVEALAWLELAAEQGLESARKKLEEEKGKGSPEDVALAAKLKVKLVKKQFSFEPRR